MKADSEYAIPLFSLIDPSKVDLSQPIPDELGEQLGLYLEGSFGIKALSFNILLLEGTPYLVMHGLEKKSIPAVCSLVDVQQSQLYRYEREDTDTVLLTPLNVKI